MRIFVEEREGTPITPEERQYLKRQLAELEASKAPEKVQASIEAMINLCGSWDGELELMCIDHDIAMIQMTLDTGVVTTGQGE